MKRNIVISLMLFGLVSLFARVDVYEVSKTIKASSQYRVEILQNGEMSESFVYESNNTFTDKLDMMTDYNHWTTFSFENSIEIKVTKLGGWIGHCDIYPKLKDVEPEIEGTQMTFRIEEPGKFYINMEGMSEHPLFIFADPLEEEIPDMNDPRVTWFKQGEVYNIGEQYKVTSNRTIYIEGGAWVNGTFALEENAKGVKIMGRGIISSNKLGRREGAKNIPVSTIYGPGDDGSCFIEGITITDPSHFCIITYTENHTRNVKLFGWYYQTDGWGGGSNSTLDESFIKVNDDNVKVYHHNQRITDLMIYQQLNGAPFQLSWGEHAADSCVVDGVDVVACYVPIDSRPGNADLINLRHHSQGNRIHDLVFRNIRADQGVYRIMGLNNDGGGSIENLRLENISISGRCRESSYLFNTGVMGHVYLKNVKVEDDPIQRFDFTFENVSPGALVFE